MGIAGWGTLEVIAQPEAELLLQTRDAKRIAASAAQLRRSMPDRAATRWQATSDGQMALFRALVNRRQG